jgi:hypothetical protein
MKLHGYTKKDRKREASVPRKLAEVTLDASAAELREIASFLVSVAEEIDRFGSKFEHAHLSDTLPQFETSPQFIVFNSKHSTRTR